MKRAFLKNLVLSLLILLLGLSFIACDIFTNDDVDDTPEEKTYYQINLEQTENGTVSVDKQKAEAGETVTLTISPAEGYKLTAIFLNGEVLDGTSFVMPEKDVTVSATFEKIIVYYNVTVSSTENGTVAADKQSAAAGETVTLTVSPAEGYKLTAIYLDGEVLEGTSFVMPEKDVTVSATFEKIIVYYNVTVSSNENGTVSADKQSATAGETVVLSATPDIAYKLDYFTVNGEAIEGNSFVMPEGDVTVSAHFAEIFAKGENIGYTNGFISTGGVDVSLDNGENPTTVINGGGEQYAYFNSVYSNKLYAEVKINVKALLNNEQYPKFGFALETDEGKRIAFFVESTTALNGNTVGRVYFDGNVYVWDTAVNTAVVGMEFSGDNYVTLAVVRDGSDVYFYVNGMLVMCESDCELLGDLSSALSVFSFNTVVCLKEYYVLTDGDADEKIQQAKVDYNKFNGENYGKNGEYTSSAGVDMTNDRGENPYIIFDGNGSPQFAYLKDVKTNQLYYQADFNVLSVKNGDAYPKFGLFAQIADKTVFFYVDMKTDLTSTTVGAVYVRNGAWDWGNARSVKVDGMAFTGEDILTLAVMRDGADFVFLVNGKFALSLPDSELELNESAFGVFGFNTEMNVYNTQLDESEEKVAEIRKLIPMVGPSKNGGGLYIDQYICDPETNTITLLRSESNSRTMASLYKDGAPIFTDRYAVEGTVRIFNTPTSGTWAGKVEFQVGVDNNRYFKICMIRYDGASEQNNSLQIEGVNNSDSGGFKTVIHKNTFPGGTDYTINYKVIYDCGTIYFIIDGKIQLIYETGWREAGFNFGVVRYADTVWSDTTISIGSEIDSLREAYKADYLEFKQAEELETNRDIASDSEQTIATGGTLRVGGTLAASNDATSSVYIKNDNGALAEYRLFKDGGKWGIERIVDGKSEIIVAPSNKSSGWMNFEVALSDEGAAFMLNGKVYDLIEGNFANASVAVGSKNGNAELRNTYFVDFADNQSAVDYIASAPVYSYYSAYTNTINKLYDKYFTNGEIEEGGFLIIGASTVASDFWITWAEDFGLTDYITGYNTGIGGTTTEDWLAAYDKLVKPFNPSRVLISVGGNDLMANGARPCDVVARLIKLIEKIHADFPNAIVYYPYAVPGPNGWKDGVWANPGYGIIRDEMKKYLSTVDYAYGIDTIDQMTKDGLPIAEYYRADNIHYNALGYSVWSKLLYDSISFPENLGKWEIDSTVPGLESGMVAFGSEVKIDLTGTEYAGNEGFTVSAVDEDENSITVTREGDVFSFVMPTANVTVTYEIIKKYENEIWTDDGVLVKGKFTSKVVNKDRGLVVAEHYPNQSIADYLPEVITSNAYLFGYAVSTDGGATFGAVISDPSKITLGEGDILKAYFAMSGSALSGGCVLTTYKSDALNNSMTFGKTTGTRLWGAVYQNGEIYTGNEYSVDFKMTISKAAAADNFVSEIYINSMPNSSTTNGRKVFIRWEKNSLEIKRQGTDTVTNAYNSGLAKTLTGITVESTSVLTLTLDVHITVTSTGFTITITNPNDTTQVYTETYTCADTVNKWENVAINLGCVQMGIATFSDIKIVENN